MKQRSKLFALLVLTGFFSGPSQACICSEILTIDSLPQLKEYDFIAHVKITGDGDFKKPTGTDFETVGLLTLEIIELFKGQKTDQILEYSKNSSCDIGIVKGEEWILFGKNINGKISVVACDRNERYKKINELRDWKYGRGFYELGKLRKLYQHPVKTFETGQHREFYSNGRIEIEETYVNGKRTGERKIWYPDGVLFCKQYYISDTLDGKSEWFYPSGQIYDEDFYVRGMHCNVSRLYYDSAIDKGWKRFLITDFYKTEDSLNFVYKRIQPQYETVYDARGRAIISREYTRLGKIRKEHTIDPDRKFNVVIYYHENGAVSSIMYMLNGKNFGYYQTYDESGFPGRGWNYDEDGKAIGQKAR